MSFEALPSRPEVMKWSPQHLADFLKRMSLSGCDKFVLQSSMSGARFVNMTENDILKFPKLHAPMISKLCSDINKKDKSRGLFEKKPTTKYREPERPAAAPCWEPDEFDEFSDDDYEDPDAEEEVKEGEESSGGEYESPTEEDPDEENDYEPNPSEAAEELTQVVRPSLPIGEGDYIDTIKKLPASVGPPPTVRPRPPASTAPITPTTRLPPSHKLSIDRRDHSPFREKSPGRALGPALPRPPMVERSKKPTREERGGGDNQSPLRGVKSLDRPSTLLVRPQDRNPKPPVWSKPQLVTPSPASATVGRSNSSARPPSPRFRPEARIETPNQGQGQGQVSRHHTFPMQTLPPKPNLPNFSGRLADSYPPPHRPHGAFPPHDTKSASVTRSRSSVGQSQQPIPTRPAGLGVPPHSSALQQPQDLDPSWYVGKIPRSQADHCLKRKHKDGSYLVRDGTKQPYTLMVLHQNKVYNIQIHMYDQRYLLGTGTNVHETFPTVGAMITHYSQTPLLLIDAKNRSASQQNQCLLLDPAGYHLT